MKPSDEAKKTPRQREREHAQNLKDARKILADKRAASNGKK